MKRVFASHDRTMVHHVRNLLSAGGIGAEVRNDLLASAMGELPPAECQAEVWVRDEDAERAAGLLRPGPDRGPEWLCGGCGERCEHQFSQCWRCGRLRA